MTKNIINERLVGSLLLLTAAFVVGALSGCGGDTTVSAPDAKGMTSGAGGFAGNAGSTMQGNAGTGNVAGDGGNSGSGGASGVGTAGQGEAGSAVGAAGSGSTNDGGAGASDDGGLAGVTGGMAGADTGSDAKQTPIYLVPKDPQCFSMPDGTSCGPNGSICHSGACCRSGALTKDGMCAQFITNPTSSTNRICVSQTSYWNCEDLTGKANTVCSFTPNKCGDPVLSTPKQTVSEIDTGPFAGNTSPTPPIKTPIDAVCAGLPEGSSCYGTNQDQFGFSGNLVNNLSIFGRCSRGACCTGCFDGNGNCVQPYTAQSSPIQTPTCGIGGGRCVDCTTPGKVCYERPPTDATLRPSMTCETM